MSQNSSWLWKSLLVSAAVALVTCAGFYLFFRIHQELEIQPARAWQFGVGAFLISAVVTIIYFRMRAER
ncbi:MAG TPA: hypothetical protein VJW20_05675 [Candidatus Angelobacter sp.]|nr:hypothetical protein [Candidatus Angelobacter sp.]